MKKNVYRGTIRPFGFVSLIFLTLGLFFFLGIILPVVKDFCFSVKSLLSGLSTFFFAFVVSFIFIFPVLGQKIVVQENKMLVYLWWKKKWIFDLTLPLKAKFGFYYQDKFDKTFNPSRKYPSVQVKEEKKKTSFPVDLYSSKQVRTIVFILNNSADEKFTDPRLRGQEKYLMHESLAPALYPEDSTAKASCEFCIEKFSLCGGIQKGYASKDRRYWVCEKCFEDFKDMFKFRVILNRKKSNRCIKPVF